MAEPHEIARERRSCAGNRRERFARSGDELNEPERHPNRPRTSPDAACLVEPQNVAEIADALGRVLTDPELASRLCAGGQIRAAKYSWRATAKVILQGLTT